MVVTDPRLPRSPGAPGTDPASRVPLSRRGLLGLGAATSAGASLVALSLAEGPASAAPRRAVRQRSPAQLRVRPATNQGAPLGQPGADPILHLLRRTTFGPTPALHAEATRLGGTAWLTQQLHPRTLDDSACDKVLAQFVTLPMTPAQILALHPSAETSQAADELRWAAIARALWSKRQLFEVMVEFWTNHFNVPLPSDGSASMKTSDDRDVIRAHALGSFTDLLQASATSPAMLTYLSNNHSRGKDPNENYGRELLELHTVGTEAHFTQADVRNSALTLTGLSTEFPSRQFAYRAEAHYVGPVQVLGWSAANAGADKGQAVAESYLSYLAAHPATARRLATKLCVRFVSDDPPGDLVERLAQVYLTSQTQIVPVLQALFASQEFADSPLLKQRRPMEDLTAAARALGIQPAPNGLEGLRQVFNLLSGMGNLPMGWYRPDGYPDVAGPWASSAGTLAQWNNHLQMAAGSYPNQLTYAGPASLLGSPVPATCGALVDHLVATLLMCPLPHRDRTALLGFLGGSEQAAPTRTHLTSDLPYLIALVMDTSTWRQR